ncbi:MAG: cell division protein ZapA [Desulfatiglans sp.]|nr:cell division protein ZapA [Thermodesulfobacteriota bacterium]MEE4352945.1 cell division protein ZapA [Desulfatiglans sp.]
MERKPVRIKILDHEYLIRGQEDEEYIQAIAEFVNHKFEEIIDSTDGLSERKTVILAAFDIASEYFQLKKNCDGLVSDIENRVQILNNRIDSITA